MREIIAVKVSAKAALAVSTSIASSGDASNELLVARLDEKVEGSFSAKATLSRTSAKIRDENALEEAVTHCVPVE